MAQVDFTLNDVRKVMLPDIRKVVKEEINQSLVEERVHTQRMFDQSHQATTELIGTVLEQIDELHDEVAGIKRIIRKHSADIMELQTRRA